MTLFKFIAEFYTWVCFYFTCSDRNVEDGLFNFNIFEFADLMQVGLVSFVDLNWIYCAQCVLNGRFKIGSYDVVELRGLIGSQVSLEAGDWHCGDSDLGVIKFICLIGLVIHIFWYVDDVEVMVYDDV